MTRGAALTSRSAEQAVEGQAGTTASRRGGRPFLWLRLFSSAGVIVAHLLLGHSDYSSEERLIAGACGVITFNILWTYFAKRSRDLPALEWVVLQLYVFFAMPVLSAGTFTMSHSFQALAASGAVRNALVAACLFLLMLLVGWMVMPGRRPGVPVQQQPRRLPVLLVFGYGVVSVGVAFLLKLYELEWKATWFRHPLLVFFLPSIAQLLLVFELRRNGGSGRARALLLILTAMMVGIGLLTSRLSVAVVPVITLALGMLGTGARLPARLVAVLILLVVVINPAKHVYRELTGYRTADFAELDFDDMIGAWVTSLEEVWVSDTAQREEAFGTTVERLNNLTVNALVLAWVPAQVPYAKGEPWLAVPYGLVPRVLWPGKPNLTAITNDRFALQFGMGTERTVERTTYAYPIIADGYWNFGWLGVALVALLAGAFWKATFRIWSRGNLFRFVFPIVLLVETQATVAVPTLLAGVVQTAVACFVVVKGLEMLGSPPGRRPRLLRVGHRE